MPSSPAGHHPGPSSRPDAFAHSAEAHAFVNVGSGNAVFYVVYFLPEDASRAPIPAKAPSDC